MSEKAAGEGERHSWGEADRQDPRLTLRLCTKCGMRRLTHHGNKQTWQTFASAEGIPFHGKGTPKCFPKQSESEDAGPT